MWSFFYGNSIWFKTKFLLWPSVICQTTTTLKTSWTSVECVANIFDFVKSSSQMRSKGFRPFRHSKRHRYFTEPNLKIVLNLKIKGFNTRTFKCLSICLFLTRYCGFFSDAIIILDNGSKFHIHKILFARKSGFFKAQFKRQQKQYYLHKVSSETFKTVVDWIYGCKIKMNVLKAIKLLVVSDYLLCSDLIDITSRFLEVILNDLNFVMI